MQGGTGRSEVHVLVSSCDDLRELEERNGVARYDGVRELRKHRG